MKIEEIRSKTEAEIEYDLGVMKKDLFDIRFRTSIDSGSNTAKITDLRRSIARAKTVLHERKRGIRGREEPQA